MLGRERRRRRRGGGQEEWTHRMRAPLSAIRELHPLVGGRVHVPALVVLNLQVKHRAPGEALSRGNHHTMAAGVQGALYVSQPLCTPRPGPGTAARERPQEPTGC